MDEFDSHHLLNCYARGVFPMADSADDPSIFLLDPDQRGIIPLDGLKISKSLRKTLRKAGFETRFNSCFSKVLSLCAEHAPGRESTWINEGIKTLYGQLHDIGYAHSVEVFHNEELIGGLYGVSLGTAFFGESMFSRKTDASKVALVKLVERLNAQGFTLLDTQFITDHLRSLGGIEISREAYHMMLSDAIKGEAQF